MFRRDETHVHEALREALINCLIHADYEGRISLLVIKRANGFEFRNPGVLRLPVEEIRRGGISDCRNRTIQQMFTLLGLGEQAGSGYSRILRAWKEQLWRVPSLQEEVALEHVSLHLSMESLLDQEVLNDLDQRFPDRFRQLPEQARLALATAHSEGRVTNRRMQEITDRHPRDLTFMFRDLVRDGFLEQQGERSGAWYVVKEGVQASGSAISIQSGVNSPQSSPQSPPQSSPQSSLPGAELQEGLLTEVAQSKWSPRERITSAILAFCGKEYRTIAQIAAELNRAHRTIQENYVRSMVKDGLLRLRHPENPTHPQQGYRSVMPTDK